MCFSGRDGNFGFNAENQSRERGTFQSSLKTALPTTTPAASHSSSLLVHNDIDGDVAGVRRGDQETPGPHLRKLSNGAVIVRLGTAGTTAQAASFQGRGLES